MRKRGLNTAISRLDVNRKWLLFSVVLVAISVVLPWYEDVDAFGAGDLYLGITGPLFLVGLMVLAGALLVGYWILAPAMGKRVPSLPVKEGALFAFLGIQDLLLLLVANSVFFHPKFGVNITLKNTKFGMILAVIGSVLLAYSGYKLYRREAQHNREIGPEGRLEPLIRMPKPEPMSERTPERTHRGESLVEHAVKATQKDISSMHQAPSEPVLERKEPIDRSEEDDVKAQPLRMDL